MTAQSTLVTVDGGDTAILPRDLPPVAVRTMALAITALFAAAIGVAVAVPFPETVTCPFVLAPEGGAEPVRAPLQGSVVAIHVKEGATVRAGDVLFTLQSDEVGVLTARIRELRQSLGVSDDLGRSLRERQGLEKPALQARVRSAREALRAAEQRERALRALGAKLRAQHDAGAIAGTKVLEHEMAEADARMTAARLARDLDDAEHALSEADSAQAGARSERELARAQIERELAEASASLAAIPGIDLEAAQRTNQTVFDIRAAHDGTVTSLGPRARGALVDRGGVLCEIARSDATLRAELTVPEAEAVRVASGRDVVLRLHAFPYTRYGASHGRVTWVSPTPSDGAVTAFATPADADVVVDGRPRRLEAGMRGDARIVVGRTTLLVRLLEPLRAARSGLLGDR